MRSWGLRLFCGQALSTSHRTGPFRIRSYTFSTSTQPGHKPVQRLSTGLCAAYCASSPLSLARVTSHFSIVRPLLSHTTQPAEPLPDASDVLRLPVVLGGGLRDEDGPSGGGRNSRERYSFGKLAHVFFFRSGAVVFWGVPVEMRRLLLRKTAELFAIGEGGSGVAGVVGKGPGKAELISMEEFEHEFAFHVAESGDVGGIDKIGGSGSKGVGNASMRAAVRQGGNVDEGGTSGRGRTGDSHSAQSGRRPRRATFANDEIFLRDFADTSELLAVSYGLAQSVKLHLHEVGLDALVQRTERLPAELAAYGRISMSATGIRKLIGELLAARYSLNLVSDILDVPEYLWRRPELEKVYLECATAVELKQRARILDGRAEVIKDALHILNSELSSASSHRIERAILFLIGVEVLFEVARFAGHK